MAAKYDVLVEQFNPSTATAATLQAQLKVRALQGWQLIFALQNTTTKAFAVFTKELVE